MSTAEVVSLADFDVTEPMCLTCGTNAARLDRLTGGTSEDGLCQSCADASGLSTMEWAIEHRLGYTELELAQRFVHRWGDFYVFDPTTKSWWMWDTNHWRTEKAESTVNTLVLQLVKDTRNIEVKKAATSDEDAAARYKSTASLYTSRVVNAIESLLEKELCVDNSAFGGWNDAPHLLNTQSGLVNLRTLEQRPCEPKDMIRKVTTIGWNPDAVSEDLELTLDRLCTMDPSIRKFLQRWVGYSLTGYSGIRRFLYIRTGPAAGKSTLFGSLTKALGEYAANPNPSVFCKSRANASHQTDFADLEGRRCVVTSEPPEGAYFDDSRVKEVTGGDEQRTRVAYGREQHPWDPIMTLTVLANERMSTAGAQKALFNRMLTIDIPNSVSDQWEVNEGIRDRLRDSVEGQEAVLNWAIRGAHEFLRDSEFLESPNGSAQALCVPQSVENATADYALSMDKLEEFLRECTEPVEGEWTQVRATYDLYRSWALASGYTPTGFRRFGEDMRSDKGYEQVRRSKGEGFVGLRLNPEAVEKFVGNFVR